MRLKALSKGKNALCLLDMPSLKHKKLCEKLSFGDNIYISCLEDKALKARFYKCEIASSSYVLALLAKLACVGDFEDLDEGFLSAECCLGEEEAGEILDFLTRAGCIVFDTNLFFHKDFESIAFFLVLLAEKFALDLVCADERELEFEKIEFKGLKELDNYDGLVLFNTMSENLRCSKQFLQIAKLKEASEVLVKTKDFEFKTRLELDESLQGTIGFLKYKNEGFDFEKVQILPL